LSGGVCDDDTPFAPTPLLPVELIDEVDNFVWRGRMFTGSDILILLD